METTLPDLPFPCKGIYSDPSQPRSSAKTTPHTFPRTDLRDFQPWASFDADIDHAIRSSMQAKGLHQNMVHIVGVPYAEAEQVWNEEDIRIHAASELNLAVRDVLSLFGITGKFRTPGGGNQALVGDPDFSWILDNEIHPKLVVEYETEWVTNLENLPACFFAGPRTQKEMQTVKALEQLYGYMTFNNLRYGILTNWTRTWVLRRIETDGRKTLEYAGPFTAGNVMPSMLKVFVGVVLLAEENWFYASNEPGRRDQKAALLAVRNYQVMPSNGSYPLLSLDFCLCDFILSSARRSAAGCVVRTELRQDVLNQLPMLVLCKIADALRDPIPCDMLRIEARNYARLHHLQGVVIPRFHGYYEVWGILHILALEPVGENIRSRKMTSNLRRKMREALKKIHAAGYLHGDISLENFCVREGTVFIIDLETCRQSTNPAEMAAELDLIDNL